MTFQTFNLRMPQPPPRSPVRALGGWFFGTTLIRRPKTKSERRPKKVGVWKLCFGKAKQVGIYDGLGRCALCCFLIFTGWCLFTYTRIDFCFTFEGGRKIYVGCTGLSAAACLKAANKSVVYGWGEDFRPLRPSIKPYLSECFWRNFHVEMSRNVSTKMIKPLLIGDHWSVSHIKSRIHIEPHILKRFDWSTKANRTNPKHQRSTQLVSFAYTLED